MRMRCLYKSVLRGDIVKPGEVLDLTEEELKLDVVRTYFVRAEDEVAADKKAAASTPGNSISDRDRDVVAKLTRDQAIMKLTQAGVKVKGNISTVSLVALYNQTFANIAEASDSK